MNYVYLAIAIISELTATMTLRATHSFTRFWPSVVVITAVCASLYCFALCLRTLNVAIVYALWSGIGIIAVAVLGWLVYGQKLDTPAMIGTAFILVGTVIINLYSQTVELPESDSYGSQEKPALLHEPNALACIIHGLLIGDAACRELTRSVSEGEP